MCDLPLQSDTMTTKIFEVDFYLFQGVFDTT
jgi:hypothetical protein